MTRWKSHEFLKIGKNKGYNDEYLAKLIEHGNAIDECPSPVIFTLAHLANCSRTLYVDLHDFVARRNLSNDFPYKHFPIKKRSGGTRWISVPTPPLWAVQAWISKNILSNVSPHKSSTAYAKGCSPKKNADIHCKAPWVLKLDLEDFFGNISERQVFHVFKKLNYPPLLSFEMARLCTKIGKHNKGKRWFTESKGHKITGYDYRKSGCLPQGAPSSPMLSNLVARKMDEELYQLAIKNGARYTRYSDDMTFSFSDTNRNDIIKFKQYAIDIVRNNGFIVNPTKSKTVPPGARKIVTGLVINEKDPKLKTEYKDSIRAHLYYCNKFGVAEHCKTRGFKSILGFKNHLEGMIQYAVGIEESLKDKYYSQLNTINWGCFEI